MTTDHTRQSLADDALALVNGGTGQQRGGSSTPENTLPVITEEQLLQSLAGDGQRDMVAASGVTDMTVIGTYNDDVISTGGGNDLVYGISGHDEIHLGAGNDTAVRDSWGNDTVIGGEGNDLFVWWAAIGSSHFDGGPGRDTLEVRPHPDMLSVEPPPPPVIESATPYKVVDGQIVFDGPASGTVTWFGQVLTFDRVEVIRVPGQEGQLV